MKKQITVEVGEWPPILQRFVDEAHSLQPEYIPRRVRKKFHEIDVTVWQGFVHFSNIEGYVENIRLKYFLNRWRARRNDLTLIPSTEAIYEIMVEADDEESKESKRPFHIERLAENIAKNGVQEPIVIFTGSNGKAELWDGNRRFYGTTHIMKIPRFEKYREQAQWIPAYVLTPSGDPSYDQRLKHCVITELNFVEKDFIPWPAYVKAEQIHSKYTQKMSADPTDPTLSRMVKQQLAQEYGLKGWRQADRWIKMYDLALQFKEYHEEEHSRESTEVDLKIQDRFEYFDELSKAGVWGVLKSDPEARDEVFGWLWDDKFKAFADVRMVPKILADPVARRQANAEDSDSVKRAIQTVIANDPIRVKDKEAANEKISQFAAWLDSFKREDFRQLNVDSLSKLGQILDDVVKILSGLLEHKIGKSRA